MAAHNVAWTGSTTTLSVVSSTSASPNVETVVADEHTVLPLRSLDGTPTPPATEYSETHRFTFINNAGQWDLADDVVLNCDEPMAFAGQVCEQPQASTAPVPATAKLPASAVPMISPPPYSPDAAAGYAANWYNGCNPSWGGCYGDDCTDFVSQALYAGGWPMILGTASDMYWWHNPNALSASPSGSYAMLLAFRQGVAKAISKTSDPLAGSMPKNFIPSLAGETSARYRY